MLSKDWQDWRTLTRNQSQPGHSQPLVGLDAGPNCGQIALHLEATRLDIDCLAEVEGCSLKSQVHSSQIYCHSTCSQCWRCGDGHQLLATEYRAEREAVSTVGSPQR
jgi:hypothetical protein